MAVNYDMCVDYETLCNIEDSLNRIADDLSCSAEMMRAAIGESAEFLAGNQFEKAKRISNACIGLTEKTGENILRANKYITELQSVMEEYGNCRYEDGK